MHLGSEGLACVLGQTPLDFLRLLAVSHQEVSGDCLDAPDQPPDEAIRNAGYRARLTERFGAAVPAKAADVLGSIPDGATEASDGPFWCWVRRLQDSDP